VLRNFHLTQAVYLNFAIFFEEEAYAELAVFSSGL
jgi:hypothetical protein